MTSFLDPEFDDTSDREGFRGRRARLGRQAGCEHLGLSLFELEPGSAAFPIHYHLGNEELVIVLSGTTALRTLGGERELVEGEVVSLPAGEAGTHQVVNRGTEPARILIASEMTAPDVVVRPESGKISAFGDPPGSPEGGFHDVYHRRDATGFWDDEPPSPARAVIERVGVGGAGTMGAGIAQLAGLGGYETLLHDPDPEALERGIERLRADLGRGAERGRWTEAEADAAAARVLPAAELADLGGCDLVIEAAPERLELKREVFATLEAACGPDAVLATNTSSLSVTAIAAGVERPQRVCGMHFFNPPPLMRLVEVVAGDATGPEALAAATEVAERMGRTPVRAADGIGFLANRGARPFSLEALRLYGERIAEPDQIDRIVRIGGGYRMGPFELQDLIGIDVNLAVAKSFYEQSFGEPRWRPHPMQQRMVDAGRLGRKTGAGWYPYEEGPHRPDDPPPLEPPAEFERRPDIEATVRWVALPDLERATVVEIARLPSTTPEELGAAGRYFTGLAKHVECTPRDAPGLVLGRIVCQLVNEACFAVGEGVGSPEDLDTALRLGFNHPRGPFEWLREIGPGSVLATLDALAGELGEDRYRAAPHLRRLAETDQPRLS